MGRLRRRRRAARRLDPFTTWRFLEALEDSGSVGRGSGWTPRHLVARIDGALIAVMPLYAKSHSQGEYIFDHNWAHAWERAGGRYYPKLQSAVPFTPATGRRFLTRPGHEDEGPCRAARRARWRSRGSPTSRACTSPSAPRPSATGARSVGLLARTTQQFHWHNRGYADFDAFLADLASRKRKAIRKERARRAGLRRRHRRADRRRARAASIGTPSGASTRTPAAASGASPT